MGRRVKVPYLNKMAEGEQLEYNTVNEDWNVYETEDGTKIRVKTVVSKIIRLDEINKTTNEPIYVINSTNLVDSDVPEELKGGKTDTQQTQ